MERYGLLCCSVAEWLLRVGVRSGESPKVKQIFDSLDSKTNASPKAHSELHSFCSKLTMAIVLLLPSIIQQTIKSYIVHIESPLLLPFLLPDHSIGTKLEREAQERIAAQKALKQLNLELEARVAKRTELLAQSNKQLQQEIAERKQAETRLKNSLIEKEILLKEIYHRVKNNLLVVSSLLEIQCSLIEDPDLIKILQNICFSFTKKF